LPIFCVGRFSGVYKKFSSLIIHIVALANEEPRSAWRTLLDSGFFGGNSEQTALRADHIFGSETLFEKLRYSLYKIRTFFETNPDEEI
jgi:hypothetical protein